MNAQDKEEKAFKNLYEQYVIILNDMGIKKKKSFSFFKKEDYDSAKELQDKKNKK